MDELTKIAVTTVSVGGILFLVLKIIQAAKGWKSNSHGNGTEKLLLNQIASKVENIDKMLTLQTQTFIRMVEVNERFTMLVGELSDLVRRGIDPERQVTQPILSKMEQRLTDLIKNK